MMFLRLRQQDEQGRKHGEYIRLNEADQRIEQQHEQGE